MRVSWWILGLALMVFFAPVEVRADSIEEVAARLDIQRDLPERGVRKPEGGRFSFEGEEGVNFENFGEIEIELPAAAPVVAPDAPVVRQSEDKNMVLILVILILVVGVVVFVFAQNARNVKARPVKRGFRGEAAPPPKRHGLAKSRSQTILGESEILLKAGDIEAAIHLLYLGGLESLGQRQAFAIDDSLTSREVLVLEGWAAPVLTRLEALVGAVERHHFARILATKEAYAKSRADFVFLSGGGG